ncbi:hypothetical protein AB3S75_044766 [Citrus x aurantiifolia]
MSNMQQAVNTIEAQAQAQLTQEKIEEWVQSVQHDADTARTKTANAANDPAQQQIGENVPFIIEDDADCGNNTSRKR